MTNAHVVKDKVKVTIFTNRKKASQNLGEAEVVLRHKDHSDFEISHGDIALLVLKSSKPLVPLKLSHNFMNAGIATLVSGLNDNVSSGHLIRSKDAVLLLGAKTKYGDSGSPYLIMNPDGRGFRVAGINADISPSAVAISLSLIKNMSNAFSSDVSDFEIVSASSDSVNIAKEFLKRQSSSSAAADSAQTPSPEPRATNNSSSPLSEGHIRDINSFLGKTRVGLIEERVRGDIEKGKEYEIIDKLCRKIDIRQPVTSTLMTDGILVHDGNIDFNFLREFLFGEINKSGLMGIPKLIDVIIEGSAFYLSDSNNKLPFHVFNKLVNDIDVILIVNGDAKKFDEYKTWNLFNISLFAQGLKDKLKTRGIDKKIEFDVIYADTRNDGIRQFAERLLDGYKFYINPLEAEKPLGLIEHIRNIYGEQKIKVEPQEVALAKNYLRLEYLLGDFSVYEEYRRDLVEADDYINKAKEIFGKVNASFQASNNSSSPLGGIDMRLLGKKMIIENRDSPLERVVNSQGGDSPYFSKELEEIQRLIQAGIIPSTERLEECRKTCQADELLSCIADILRMEEERDLPAEGQMKELLVKLAAG